MNELYEQRLRMLEAAGGAGKCVSEESGDDSRAQVRIPGPVPTLWGTSGKPRTCSTPQFLACVTGPGKD